MRIYENMKQALSEVQRDLSEMGVEVKTKSMQDKIIEGNDDFVTKEIQAYQFCVLNTADKDDTVENLDWCKAEFTERISNKGLNPGEAWKLRKSVWEEFLHGNPKKFGYTYSERMKGQVEDVIRVLKNDIESRQAIIQIYDQNIDNKNRGGKVRIPCSISYHFMYREGKLDMIYNMRSCDIFTHFRNDIWMACKLKDYIAEKLGVKSGKFFMFVSSLHAYKKDCKGIF